MGSDPDRLTSQPYDCGLFYTRRTPDLTAVFGPGGAMPAYLAAGSAAGHDKVPAELAAARHASASAASPLHLHAENSARWRGLPVYAALISTGRDGYRDIIGRQIAFARHVAQWIRSSAHWDLLLAPDQPISTIVLFAPSEGRDANEAIARLKRAGEIYVGPTTWRGKAAIRLAVSHWATSVADDAALTIAELERVGAELVKAST